MKIAYEKHPVSPERKRDLRDKGLKILDIRFKPADVESDPREEIAEMSGPDLKEALEAHGVESIPRGLNDRRALLEKIMFVGV